MMIDPTEWEFGKIEARNDFQRICEMRSDPLSDSDRDYIIGEFYAYLDWIMRGRNDWVVERKLGYIQEVREILQGLRVNA